MISPEAAVDIINERFGRHPGFRALHAKGSLYRATFVATPDAARLTRAAHMQGQAVDATVRFSNGSGDPASPDHRPDVRGMATSFHLPDGSRTDISAHSVPYFPVSTPEAFLEFLGASSGGVAALWRLPMFVSRHPGVLRTFGANSTALRPPASYAGITYYGVHAYRWVDSHGSGRYVRYRWEPEHPEPRLAVLEARRRGRNYLQDELAQRLPSRPFQFSLVLQLAGEGDRIDDPSAVWPDDRVIVIAGTLTVNAAQKVDEANDPLVFDPLRLTDGIEPSGDPVLKFRPRAYSVSVARRAAPG